MLSRPYYNITGITEFLDLIKNKDDCNEIKILNKNKSETNEKQKYSVIRYNKNLLTKDSVNTYGLFRSVILNSTNKVVSFAPPKSVDSDIFMKKYPFPLDSNIVAEEFVEGTMINVFWDPNVGLSGAWEIATRNTVGAESKFYKKNESKTFREMFMEALKLSDLLLDGLCKKYCYSFVLQHPENRIVVPFDNPELYLVAVYDIINNDDGSVSVYLFTTDEIKNMGFWGFTQIKFPQIYTEWNSYDDLIEKYASQNTSYNILGVVFKHTITGERCKIRNPVYEEIRKLRGNQPKLQYQYLSLRKEGKVSEFLKYYPENKKDFTLFREQLHNFTKYLYKNYVSCYIEKSKPLINYSEQFRTHMFHIHQIYLTTLKEKKQHVTNTVVINYVNNLHPNLLMYCLNYNLRQRNIDFIKSDFEINNESI